jgi:hypothetical protein
MFLHISLSVLDSSLSVACRQYKAVALTYNGTVLIEERIERI